MVQWLGLGAFTAEGRSSIPGWGTKILQAVQHGQKEKKKKVKLAVEQPGDLEALLCQTPRGAGGKPQEGRGRGQLTYCCVPA